jgi:cell fate regulator YaaT (PSP1 superfamily)
MLPPDATEMDNVYEVRFKNTRKGFYRNVNGLRLSIGNWVVLEGDRGGFDVGQISLGGVLASLQFNKRKVSTDSILKLYRKANESDLALLQESRDREQHTITRSREIVRDLRLDMKLSDVEYQGDGTKATFYYIADHRVDFRELIKLLAREFKIRVEMKQIGLRHESALVGGIGVCGRELCCSTWLTEFKVVTTSAARYQNLSLNPSKISGLCGRLKCCLNFELDSYKDALKDFPDTEWIDTIRGKAYVQKTDIFKHKMWFAYPSETTWYPLEVEVVKKIVELNKKGEPVPALTKSAPEEGEEDNKRFDFVDVVGHGFEKLTEEERRKKKKKKEKEQARPIDAKPKDFQKEREMRDARNRERDQREKELRGDKSNAPQKQNAPQNKERPNVQQKQNPVQGREKLNVQQKQTPPPQHKDKPNVQQRQNPPQNKQNPQNPPIQQKQNPPQNRQNPQNPPIQQKQNPPQNKQNPQNPQNPPIQQRQNPPQNKQNPQNPQNPPIQQKQNPPQNKQNPQNPPVQQRQNPPQNKQNPQNPPIQQKQNPPQNKPQGGTPPPKKFPPKQEFDKNKEKPPLKKPPLPPENKE